MAKKPVFKDLKKYVKELNKLKLTDKIDLSDFEEDDLDDLAEAFVSAIETIDESGKTSKLKGHMKIVNYYQNVVFDYLDSKNETNNDKEEKEDNNMDNDKIKELLKELKDAEDNDDIEEFLEDNDIDEDDAGFDEDDSFKKNKGKTKKYLESLLEEDEKEEDEDEEEETGDETDWDEVEEMSYKEVKTWTKERGLKLKKDLGITKDDWEDDEEECTEKIKKALTKSEKKSDKKKDKKDKKKSDKKKDKKKDKDEEEDDDDDGDVKLPKGWKKGSVNSEMYLKIAEGDAPIEDLAIMLNKGKKKGADKLYKKVVHTVARVLSKGKPISITFNGGGDDDGVVNFAE